MNWTLATHLTYLAIAVPATIWVATTLSRHGGTYLRDVYGGDDRGRSINQLLTVGFYLVNVGFVLLFLRIGVDVTSLEELVETVSTKVGLVLLVLGGVHFLNLGFFSGQHRRTQLDHQRQEALRQQRPGPPPGWAPPYPGPIAGGPR